MTRREPGQLSLSDVLLFGREQDVGELMRPQMQRIDALLDDEVLVDEVLTVLRRRRPESARSLAASRGGRPNCWMCCFGETTITELGVLQPVIPKPGYRSAERIAHERQRWFRRGRAWRAGGEARVGRLKGRFGMARSRYRGRAGPQRTALWAALANNLTAIAARAP